MRSWRCKRNAMIVKVTSYPTNLPSAVKVGTKTYKVK
jgi:hypothetical protein